MSVFLQELNRYRHKTQGRNWLYVPYDQLSDRKGPLSREDPDTLGIIIIESPWKASLRPYHKQKLAFIISNTRHFALEQAQRGIAVRHVISKGPFHTALEPLFAELGKIRVMEPAERELRKDLERISGKGGLEIIPNEFWLTDRNQFTETRAQPPWRMDSFYRGIRRKSGLLMKEGKPVGGRFSFDSENRKAWKGSPEPPEPPVFPDDPVKQEVQRLIEDKFFKHPGKLDMGRMPSTLQDAIALWSWAKRECLASFGTWEDAMSTRSTGLFHTRISSLLNLNRITPSMLVSDAADMDIGMNSKEGFIRQIIGWREFVRHVHYHTDGFRNNVNTISGHEKETGDGGYRRWSGHRWKSPDSKCVPDAGASPNLLGSANHIPPLFWGAKSGLACVDFTISGVWDEAYGHHITRLMILLNLATLLDVIPRELADWFWVSYSDAYDWVVEPNVLGMGTYSTGEIMTTKPYVSGAAYINRMSDFCRKCAFNPGSNCPFTPLYWAFMERHKDKLRKNARMSIALASLSKRENARKSYDRDIYKRAVEILSNGGELTPEKLA